MSEHGHRSKILTMILIFINLPQYLLEEDGKSDIFNEDETRSRILMLNGNMYFHAGKYKNITFVAGTDGSIFFGDKNLNLLPKLTEFEAVRSDVGTTKNRLQQLVRIADTLMQQINLKSGDIGSISTKLNALIKRFDDLNTTKRDGGGGGGGGGGRKLRNVVNSLKTHMILFDARLRRNECEDQPCRNGGTCIDLYQKFVCLCPSQYEGANCDTRVDECKMYEGTHAGCQNNATCVQMQNGFRCICPTGFHGALCQSQSSTCDLSADLCGPAGHCIPSPVEAVNPDEGQRSAAYRCLCEWGYRSSADKANPTCEDIDECESNPCYPGATCINLPGTFRCSGCPAGMTGNGVNCVDIDECADENVETCSKDPPVKCINTIGSFKCESCPPGFKGDGRICTKQNPCELTPCYPGAKCFSTGMSSLDEWGAFRCECPAGMIGEGIGSEGCYKSNITLCRADTCFNQATCQVISETEYRCHCKWGYAGKQCETATPCLNNACRNRGECIPKMDGTYQCQCMRGYYGTNCEFEEDGCGGHTTNSTGSIKYPDWTWYHFGRNKTCEWVIVAPETDKVIEMNFTTFHLPARYSSCASADANVTLRDGDSSDSPLVGSYCGSRGSSTAPVHRPIHFSSNKAYITFVSTESSIGIGGFSIQWQMIEKRCGGRIYSDEGQISLYGYKPTEICQWHISVDPQMHIEVTVDPMRLGSGDVRNCSINSLELFDGLEIDESKRILHLCSSESTRTFVRTTLPYFTVYFKSDQTTPFSVENCKGDGDPLCSRGFTIRYRTIKLTKDCGGTILPDANGILEGTIQSPNYGFNYFPNLDCLWLIDASTLANGGDGQVIKAEILDIDVPSAPVRVQGIPNSRLRYLAESSGSISLLLRLIRPCRFDYLTFKDGGDASQPIIGRYCNSKMPNGPIVSSGSKMVIQFHSNQSVNGKGFKIRYLSVCEKHFTAPNGTIQSFNYPNGSKLAFKCSYVIDADKTKAIRLRFNYIGLHTDSHTCFYDLGKHESIQDYVEFSGGRETHEEINKRYVCGRYPFIAPFGEVIVSATQPLRIILSSSGENNKGIFFSYEQFEIGCGGLFDGTSGTITSPNYPEKYFAHMFCLYIINVSSDKRVRLTFDVFEMEVVPNKEECSYDSVEMYDTYLNEEDHTELHGRFCGSLLPPPILSSSSQLTLVFKSDQSVNGAGFVAKWQAIDANVDCHRTFITSSGRIEMSTEINRKFVQCDYQIAVMLPSTKRILLRFENFSLPCEDGTLMMKYSFDNFSSCYNLKFVSLIRVLWLNNCRNGVNEHSPGFGGLYRDSEICDDHPVKILRSQGNRIFMRLTATNAANIYFNIFYEQIDSDCGGRMDGLQGALSAPQYPLRDSRTLNCDWHIAVAEGNRVRFTITALDDLNSADTNGFCSSFAPNHIDVIDGPFSTDHVLRRYCKKELSLSSVDSIANELTIRYRQHGGTYFGSLFGFLAHYTTVCNEVLLSGHYGVLQSPGYPHDVTESRFCKWRIQTTKGNRIKIMFHLFKISERYTRYTSPCRFNYFEIAENQLEEGLVTLDGKQNNITTMRKFCDHSGVPVWLLTKKEYVDITFFSKLVPENHFWLTWANEGCGGEIMSPSKFEVKTDELVQESEFFECSWKITAPIGMRVKFCIENFSIFDIGSGCTESETNQFSGLAFYSGTSNATGQAQKVLCSSLSRFNYTSHTNELFVLMVVPRKLAKPDSQSQILTGEIQFIQAKSNDECGAVVDMHGKETIYIHSPNYPKLYPKAVECVWLVRAPDGFVIHFNLTQYTTLNYHPQRPDIKIWRSSISNLSCQTPQAFLEGSITFYDGNSSTSNVLERFCQSTKQHKFIASTSNRALLTFQGGPYDRSYLSGDDERQNVVGFSLTITLRCGGTLFAENRLKVFKLHSIDENECKFIIKAADGERIYLRMDQIKFGGQKPSKSRSKNATTITIYDGLQDNLSTLGVFEPECNPNNYERDSRVCSNREIRSRSSAVVVHLRDLNNSQLDYLYFTYSTEIESCGGTINSVEGVIHYPFVENDVQCEWYITNSEGNQVELEIISLKLPASDYCAKSYLEIREMNLSGPISFRECHDTPNEAVQQKLYSQSFWIRLRFILDDDDDADVEQTKPDLKLKFKKVFGGTTSSRAIKSPSAEDWRLIDHIPIEWHLIGRDEHWLRFTINSIEIPDERDENNFDSDQRSALRGLVFNEGMCQLSGENDECGPVQTILAGYNPPNVFLVRSNVATILFNAPSGSSFSLIWEDIPIAKANGSSQVVSDGQAITPKGLAEFDCGTSLVPTYDPQYLTNPGGTSASGKFTTVKPKNTTSPSWLYFNHQARWFGGYANNLKCRWDIVRPKFAGIALRIISMDLEEHVDCQFDYVAISSDASAVTFEDGQLRGNIAKYCKHKDVGTEEIHRFDEIVTIFFITDRNRAGRGFVIEYKLVCRSFYYVTLSMGLLDATLSSPNYPNSYQNNLTCFWTIFLESSRTILARFIDMDIEESEGCTKDNIILQSNSEYSEGNTDKKLCGQLNGWNKTFENGSIFIHFNTDSQIAKKGFSLHLSEQLHDCSSDQLVLHEGDSPKILTSPDFPQLSPNSLDCVWVISGPSGHRIKFTVDPLTFDLQSNFANEECADDYLEVRNGPSKLSPLIGRYCHRVPPSTIFSSSSYLYIRYQTNSYVQSTGFNATYEIASCGGSVVLPVNGTSKIRSLNYPEPYPGQSQCDWIIMSPLGHYVNASFDHLWLSYTENCTNDSIALRERNSTGEYILEPTCVSNDVRGKYYTTSRNIMDVTFVSSTKLRRSSRLFCLERKCGFQLSVATSKIECGGEISDDSGQLTAPGYPNRLHTHIICDWQFRAGIGFRYLFDFSFINRDNFYQRSFSSISCYPEVIIANGMQHFLDHFGSTRNFCINQTRFISTTDLVAVRFNERIAEYEKQSLASGMDVEKIYAPFKISYIKVPADFDDNACMYYITTNKTINISISNDPTFSFQAGPKTDFCHLSVERRSTSGTTVLQFRNFTTGGYALFASKTQCVDYDNFVSVSALNNDPWSFETRFCDGLLKKANNFTIALPHRIFDIYVYQRIHITTIAFNLNVQMMSCGGVIYGPESGVITSPGFDANSNSTYEPETQCVWSLKAPEGRIVKIKITDMDLEYNVECKHDFLKLFEGAGTDASLVHVYCNNVQDEPLPDRFREINSHGRYLTLYFVTDRSIQRRGFRIEYSFGGRETECGFSVNRLSGTILSPNSPKDYSNNLLCIWDIAVPFGYHIALRFNRFDVEKSKNCFKDYVKISQEHQSRAMAPIGGYYFLFDHEEEMGKLCGYETPNVMTTESNRLKIEFKTDPKITAKGFNITWKAECGTTFKLNHGVVTSPYYPRNYPNENVECNYLISPESSNVPIVILKILDLDLDPYKHDFNRRPCETDYIQLIEVNENRIIDTYCANDVTAGGIAPISIMGPIGLRFVTNISIIEDVTSRRKNYRGFKISYALSKCGGEINLKEDGGGMMSAVVTSPGFPLRYHHNLKCVWNISAPEDRIINIKYANMDLEESNECVFDYLELFDGAEVNNATSFGRICGDIMPLNQIFTSKRFLTVLFVSDQSMNKSGFKIIVTATIGPAQGCGGEIAVTDTFELQTPTNKSTSLYYNNLRCGWTLKAPVGKIIEVEIVDFELEPPDTDSGKCYDYIVIYDGYKTIAPFLLANSCQLTAGESPLMLRSSYRTLFVYFESDSDNAYRGIRIKFTAITAPCGGRKIASADFVELQYESEKMLTRTSPKHERCRWMIYSQEQVPLRIVFSQFSFPTETSDCTDEYIEIRDAGTAADCQHPACRAAGTKHRIIRICGTTLPADFVSGTSVVQITSSAILQSEHTSKFILKYQTLDACNRTIDARYQMTGRITSPNYPNFYNHNSSCITNVTARDGYQILIVFKDFHLERVRRTFYGRLAPSFRHVLSGRRNINQFYDVVYQSANPSGSGTCEYDYIEIIDSSGNRTSRYCDYKLPPTFLSTGSNLSIYFKSDETMAPGGFDAYYFAVQPTKTQNVTYYDFGSISEFQGAVTNVGYPGYQNSQKMRFQINPPSGHRCHLILIKMDFGKNLNGQCSEGDHMLLGEITPTDEQSTDLDYLPCRNVTSFPKKMSIEPGDSVILEFYTDNRSEDNGEGFRIEWECENYFVPQV